MEDELLKWIREAIRSASPSSMVNYDDFEIRLIGTTDVAAIFEVKSLDQLKMFRVKFNIQEL